METRLRNDPSLGLYFTGWHNLYVLPFEASGRLEFYMLARPDWHYYEASEVLFVATPPFYWYYSYGEIADGQAMFQAIAEAPFCILIHLSFAPAEALGKMFRESSGPLLSNNTSVVMLLVRHGREFVDALGFTTILDGFALAKGHAYLACRPSAEVD